MKYRLDMFLVMKGICPSRERAKRAIIEGQVFVNGKTAQPSTKINGDEEVTVGEILQYVSRGALKLEKAKDVFKINFKDKTVLDIGSSTGGFTEISLLNGAKKVIAVDVGNNQMHEKIRNNPKVSLHENCDFRFIDNSLLQDVDLIVSDVSFISLRYIFPKIIEGIGTTTESVILFKPQFECGPVIAKKFAGVIRDKKIHEELLEGFERYLKNLNFTITSIDYSPITGKEGNIEYLFYLNGGKSNYNIKQTIEKVFSSL